MSYYTEEDLRDFEKYANEQLATLKKEGTEVPPEEKKALTELIRIIQGMYYNAMVFESFIDGRSYSDYILSKDLTQLPLHLNDNGLVSRVIVKWRLERGK